jgi:hypothetical protein
MRRQVRFRGSPLPVAVPHVPGEAQGACPAPHPRRGTVPCENQRGRPAGLPGR